MYLLGIGSTLKGKNLLLEEQILSLRVDPYRKGRQNSRVASPVSIPIHLNTIYLSYLVVVDCSKICFRLLALTSPFAKCKTLGHSVGLIWHVFLF